MSTGPQVSYRHGVDVAEKGVAATEEASRSHVKLRKGVSELQSRARTRDVGVPAHVQGLPAT